MSGRRLDAHIVRSVGTFQLDVDLSTERAETVAVLGPNGSGKSTLFRCLAGLLPVDRGSIVLDGVILDDAATGAYVRPAARPVGMVFQDYLLFPNLTALENVAFGLRARRVPKAEARRRAAEWLERVGLSDHAQHRPLALSGGQAQRVALARALATEPRLLLLDEPLAALDAGTRSEVRRDLRHHLATFDGVRLLVTHDPVDAFALADRVVVLEHGRILQAGALADITAHPRSRYVADLIGVNLLRGRGDQGTILTPTGARIIPADAVDGDTFAVIQPHSVAVYLSPPDGSPRNVWQATVGDVDRRSDRVRVRLDGVVPLVAEITAGALSDLALGPGDHVWAAVKATDIATYPA